jgi:long-chain-fatty-acid---luciferin-component ligase
MNTEAKNLGSDRNRVYTKDANNVLIFEELETLDPIDDLIYQCEDFFKWTFDQLQAVQQQQIIEAFKYHYNDCTSYYNYCKLFAITPQDIQTYDDLIKIPLIPSTMFKLREITSCSQEEIVKVCTSSGTMGSLSKIYRNETTLNRFIGSIRNSVEQLLDLDDAFCFNLGPSAEEAGDLWFSYAINIVDLIFPSKHFVENNIFHPELVYQQIMKQYDLYENLILIGAPIMFLELISYMENNNLAIEDSNKIFFITAGGWKRFSGKAISRPIFEEKIEKVFQGAQIKHFRDVLNMVELNTVLMECEYQIKHIVPWVKVLILDPKTLHPVANHEVGLIAYLDPSTTSYPCFILTDDFGRIVHEDYCACGRTGQGIEIIRRVKSIESRGCSLKLDRNYAKQ